MLLRHGGIGGVDVVDRRAWREYAKEFLEQGSGSWMVRAVLEPEQLDPWLGSLSFRAIHGCRPWVSAPSLPSA